MMKGCSLVKPDQHHHCCGLQQQIDSTQLSLPANFRLAALIRYGRKKGFPQAKALLTRLEAVGQVETARLDDGCSVHRD
jgi:hypothetical protein